MTGIALHLHKVHTAFKWGKFIHFGSGDLQISSKWTIIGGYILREGKFIKQLFELWHDVQNSTIRSNSLTNGNECSGSNLNNRKQKVCVWKSINQNNKKPTKINCEEENTIEGKLKGEDMNTWSTRRSSWVCIRILTWIPTWSCKIIELPYQ